MGFFMVCIVLFCSFVLPTMSNVLKIISQHEEYFRLVGSATVWWGEKRKSKRKKGTGIWEGTDFLNALPDMM